MACFVSLSFPNSRAAVAVAKELVVVLGKSSSSCSRRSPGVVYVPDVGEFTVSGQKNMNRAIDGDIATLLTCAGSRVSW